MISAINLLSVAEFATLTQLLCKIHNGHKVNLENPELDSRFAQADSLATELIIAIKRVAESAGLDKANEKRNITIRNMFTMLEGACVSLFAEESDAAKKILEIANRYGRKMTTEKQLEESAHIDSLLQDLDKSEIKAIVEKIHCGAEYVAELSANEAEFKAAQVAANRIKLESKSEKSATAIKKELREFLNGTLFPYITALYTLEKEKYANFYREIEKEVKNANDSARKAAKNTKDTKETAAQPSGQGSETPKTE